MDNIYFSELSMAKKKEKYQMKILCEGSEKFCNCCEWSDRNIL